MGVLLAYLKVQCTWFEELRLVTPSLILPLWKRDYVAACVHCRAYHTRSWLASWSSRHSHDSDVPMLEYYTTGNFAAKLFS